MKILMIFVTKTVMRVMTKSVTSFVQQFARVPADCRGLIRIQSLTPVDKQNSGEGWRGELPRWELYFYDNCEACKACYIVDIDSL